MIRLLLWLICIYRSVNESNQLQFQSLFVFVFTLLQPLTSFDLFVTGECNCPALYMGHGLCLCPLWLCSCMWVRCSFCSISFDSFIITALHPLWQEWVNLWLTDQNDVRLHTLMILRFDIRSTLPFPSVLSVDWTTSAQWSLCRWTELRTWLQRRSQWPCTPTTCLDAPSPTLTCR